MNGSNNNKEHLQQYGRCEDLPCMYVGASFIVGKVKRIIFIGNLKLKELLILYKFIIFVERSWADLVNCRREGIHWNVGFEWIRQ